MVFITLWMLDIASSRYTTPRWAWTRSRLPPSAKPMQTNGLVVPVEREAGNFISTIGLGNLLPLFASQFLLPVVYRDGVSQRNVPKHDPRNSTNQLGKHCPFVEIARGQEFVGVRLHGSSSSGSPIFTPVVTSPQRSPGKHAQLDVPTMGSRRIG